MKIDILTVGAFAMNAYILSDEKSAQAMLIDPGAEAEKLIRFIDTNILHPQYIINTHCHIDHTAEVAVIQEYYQIPFYIHEGEKNLLVALEEQGRYFGVRVNKKPEVTRFLNDNESLTLADEALQIIHTPGHSPGGISIKIGSDLFVGDTLFRDSIGRTDLPGGNQQQLLHSIKNRLLILDDGINVYPGHGPVTTIGRERNHNPFLNTLL